MNQNQTYMLLALTAYVAFIIGRKTAPAPKPAAVAAISSGTWDWLNTGIV